MSAPFERGAAISLRYTGGGWTKIETTTSTLCKYTEEGYNKGIVEELARVGRLDSDIATEPSPATTQKRGKDPALSRQGKDVQDKKRYHTGTWPTVSCL